MVGPDELEQHDRPLDGQEQVARRIPLVKDLHVPGPGCIAHIDRVEQQAGVHAVVDHLGPQAVPSEVDEGLPVDGDRGAGSVDHGANDTHPGRNGRRR